MLVSEHDIIILKDKPCLHWQLALCQTYTIHGWYVCMKTFIVLLLYVVVREVIEEVDFLLLLIVETFFVCLRILGIFLGISNSFWRMNWDWENQPFIPTPRMGFTAYRPPRILKTTLMLSWDQYKTIPAILVFIPFLESKLWVHESWAVCSPTFSVSHSRSTIVPQQTSNFALIHRCFSYSHSPHFSFTYMHLNKSISCLFHTTVAYIHSHVSNICNIHIHNNPILSIPLRRPLLFSTAMPSSCNEQCIYWFYFQNTNISLVSTSKQHSFSLQSVQLSLGRPNLFNTALLSTSCEQSIHSNCFCNKKLHKHRLFQLHMTHLWSKRKSKSNVHTRYVSTIIFLILYLADHTCRLRIHRYTVHGSKLRNLELKHLKQYILI